MKHYESLIQVLLDIVNLMLNDMIITLKIQNYLRIILHARDDSSQLACLALEV